LETAYPDVRVKRSLENGTIETSQSTLNPTISR